MTEPRLVDVAWRPEWRLVVTVPESGEPEGVWRWDGEAGAWMPDAELEVRRRPIRPGVAQ